MRRQRQLRRLAVTGGWRWIVTLVASAVVGVLLATGGCASLLGIPSEISEQEGGVGSDSSSDGRPSLTDQSSPPADQVSPKLDAGPDALAVDAADAAGPTCDVTKNFGTPVLIASLSTPDHESLARLTDDQLTVFFEAVRLPSSDAGSDSGVDGSAPHHLYTATRATQDAPFGPVTLVPGVGGADEDRAPSVTSDLLTIFFSRRTFDDDSIDIYKAERSSVTDPFDTGSAIANLDVPTDSEITPFVRGDGTEIWFAAIRPPSTTADIQLATFAVNTGYAVTTPTNVNTGFADETHPVISRDGLALYFASNRFGGIKGNNTNIWIATRTSTSADFGTPKQLNATGINTAANEEPSWISPFGCRLYFTSNRAGGAGRSDLYLAIRPM